MKINFGKNPVFACYLSDTSITLAKFLPSVKSKRPVLSRLEIKDFPVGSNDEAIAKELSAVLKKSGYHNEAVLVLLPRSKVTCRVLKVPSQNKDEILKIVSLQASRYLPYPAADLISGCQIISVDKFGYSQINVVIVHKDTIARYARLFEAVKPKSLSIFLSSYGLLQFFYSAFPEYSGAAGILDVDAGNIELAVVNDKKLLFSRSFKVNRFQPGWEGALLSELNKSRDAYIKEVALEFPQKFFVTGQEKSAKDVVAALTIHPGQETAVASYSGLKIGEEKFSEAFLAEHSLAPIIGFGFSIPEESLNLVLPEKKKETQAGSRRQENLRLAGFIFGIILILGLAAAQNISNKEQYLKKLKAELGKVSLQAKPLEEIDKRARFVSATFQKRNSSVNLFYELHKVMPEQVWLASLNYDESSQIILRGQAQSLDAVFTLVNRLEGSKVFKGHNIKVRYATKRATGQGEITDFEVVCARK